MIRNLGVVSVPLWQKRCESRYMQCILNNSATLQTHGFDREFGLSPVAEGFADGPSFGGIGLELMDHRRELICIFGGEEVGVLGPRASRQPGMSVATTGTPAAIDSRIALGSPSLSLLRTERSQACSRLDTS